MGKKEWRGGQKQVPNLLQVNNEKKGKDEGIGTPYDLQQTQKMFCFTQLNATTEDAVILWNI